MKVSTLFAKSILALVAMVTLACSPKGFQTSSQPKSMADQSEMIPELMSEGLSNSSAGINDGASADQLVNGTKVDLSQIQEQLSDDLTYGYKAVVIIDRAKEKTSATAQSLAIFKLNEESQKFELFNANSWKVSTGVMIPITETITNKLDGTTREVTSKRFTPTGFFAPNVIDAKARSNAYDSEMPNAVWFWRESGYAIHATGKGNYSKLGKRASHGCIRLTLDNSKMLFDLVKSFGRQYVVELNRLTGKPVVKANGDLSVVKRYPVLVVVTDSADSRSNKVDMKAMIESPEQVVSLFDQMDDEEQVAAASN